MPALIFTCHDDHSTPRSCSLIQAVGAILVIDHEFRPAVIAYLWTDSVKAMLYNGIIIGGIVLMSSVEVSLSPWTYHRGFCATTIGIALIIAVATPKTGYIATPPSTSLRRALSRNVLCHIYTHMDPPVAHVENGIGTIHEHFDLET